VLADPAINTVFITTQHDTHVRFATAALEAGKHVFLEKPAATTQAGLDELRAVAERHSSQQLLVGFNRRFSPHAARLRELLAPIAGPKTMLYRVNAGVLPPDHWLLDREEGGGRLVGEGVHFFDFLAFLCGTRPERVFAAAPRGGEGNEAVVALAFADGSAGSVVYTGAGSSEVGKERVEVFAGGATFVLEDFRSLEVHGLPGAKGTSTRAVEKGQREQLANFHRALRGEGDVGVTAEDGWLATWCAEQAAACAMF